MTALKNAYQAANVAPGRTNAVVVDVPMVLPSVANLREHWAVKAKRVKRQRDVVALALRAARPLGLAPFAGVPHSFVVTLTRVAPRALDDDNLRGAFKAVRDEVAAYFGVNDNDPRVTWQYAQAKGPAAVELRFEVAP